MALASARRVDPALLVILAGVAAALHIGKVGRAGSPVAGHGDVAAARGRAGRYVQSGIAGVAAGVLTAAVAAVNMAGNIGSGRLLQRGVAPSRLLTIGFATMGLAATAGFAGSGEAGLTPALRYGAVLIFSGVGGLIPATLFALAVRQAPGEGALATTLGWVLQWSALGQFAGPPLVAAVASAAGGWQWTWVATGACSVLGLLLAAGLGRVSGRGGPVHR